jgi:hypothetical protein
MNSQAIRSLFADPVTIAIILTPLGLLACDIATGILRAVMTNQFKARRLADFLGTSFMKYVAMLVGVIIVWLASGDSVATSTASLLGMGILSLSIGASIIENMQALGLPPTVERDAETVVKDLESIADPAAKPEVKP